MDQQDAVNNVYGEKLFEYYRVGWELDWLNTLDGKGRPRGHEYLRRLDATLGLIASVYKDNTRTTILDAGCGVCIYDVNILKNFPEAAIYAFDISEIQLPQGKKLADKFNVGNRLNLFVANVNEPPLDASFDIIICTEVLEHVLEPSQTLNALKKISKSNSHFILSTPQTYNGLRQSGFFYKQILPNGKIIHTQDASMLVGNIPHYEYYHALYDVKKFKHMLQENGLDLVSMVGVDFFVPLTLIPANFSFFHALIIRIKNGICRGINFISAFLPSSIDMFLNRYFDNRYASILLALCTIKIMGDGN